MARRIVITSGKGGVGKTTVCANLGYALALRKAKVLLVDVDFGLNNLDVVMGVENKIVYDLIDVLEGRCRPKQAIIQDFFTPDLYVFPSNHTYSNVNITGKIINDVLSEIEFAFDYILIDCPAGIENGFYRAAEIADEAIVVTTPHISSVRDADKIIGFLQNFNIDNLSLIVNRARGDLILNGDMISIETINEYLNIDLLGVIPEDDNIAGQLLIGGAVRGESEAKDSFIMVAKKMHEGKKEVFDCTKKYKGMFGAFRRNLKRIV